jgi:type II secretory pathway pseudopilin PulG
MKTAGFSLIELLVATTIVIVGVTSLAQLFLVSADSSRLAHSSSTALFVAQQKIEALRADSIEFGPSPPGTLGADTAPYVEYLSADGTALDAGVTLPPVGTVFVRRWSVELLPGSSREGLLLQVVVIPWSASSPHAAGAAHLVTVKARKAG